MKKNYGRLKIAVLIIVIVGLYILLVQTALAGTRPPNKAIQVTQIEVTGTVTDADGVPLPGVTIAVKGENRGTITDFEGNYELKVTPRDTLIFSHIGFKTVEEPVNGRSEIDIWLVKDISALRAVEINAGYYNTTAREATGNISRITAEAIEKQPVTNPLAAMQGRMPGVHITQTSGVPGSGFEIQIRGRNSIGAGNDPLYIIDGVPFSSESLGFNQTSTIFPGTVSPLNGINPDDIASIEVLKDADATAIYGSRGANGVVLITTKKGKPGRARLEINMYSGIGEITRKMNLMNTEQYLEMRREAFDNDGISQYPARAYDVNGTWDQNRYTDWQEVLIGGKANSIDVNAAISGGSLKTQYLLSGGYHRETTVFPGDNDYTKASVHTSISHNSFENRFNFRLKVNYVVDDSNLPATDLSRQARQLAPNAPALYDEEGNLNWENNTWTNPLGYFLNQRFIAKGQYLLSSALLSYKLWENVEILANIGYNSIQLEDKRLLPSTMYNPAAGFDSSRSLVYSNTGSRKSWIIEPQLKWERSFDDLEVNLLLGSTFQKKVSSKLALGSQGFPSNQLINDISAASFFVILNNSNAEYKYHALFGRINLNYKEKYIINLTGRRDGSSRFGPGNQFSNFGAVGAAWIFSEEDFIESGLPFLSFGKLRGSYGTTGNDQIGDYQFLDTYTVTGRSYNNITGLEPTQLFNPNFGWEINKKMETGLELGFLDDRVFLSTSYYQNRSSNQLVGIPLPRTTGFPSLQANLDAVVQNTGWEFQLTTVNFQKEKFNWITSVNLSIPRNELVSFPGLAGSTYANNFIIGEPLNIEKLYHYTGLNTETGIYEFEDYNSDGIINSPSDKQFIQYTGAMFYGGIHNNLTYNNWDLSFLFQFTKQDNRKTYSIPGVMQNMPVEVLDRWQEPGDNNTFQRYTTGGNSDARRAASLYNSSNAAFADASFIRLKNVSLSYSFPDGWIKGIRSLIFLRGRNLLTFTKFKGADPEFVFNGYIPPLRQMTAGIQLSL